MMAVSPLQIRVAVLRVPVKWTRKILKYSNDPPSQKKSRNINNITKLDQCPCQDSIRGLHFRNQSLTNGARNTSTRLQAILDHAVSNCFSNNIQALASELLALQPEQLSEPILFLIDCAWCTLQSNDTNFRYRSELQLN